jgi:probable F420-dependent oxidoreductase
MAQAHLPCGISIPQSFPNSSIDVDLIRAFAPRAEALGFDSLWVSENILGANPVLESVALLTYTAALTTRARLGTSVLLTVVRNPVLMAKSLATLDQLSRGRLTVGIGIGGARVQEPVFGVTTERRPRRFIEGLQVMKALWTQQKATFEGEFWNFKDVAMEPKPVQRPHPPVWFGASEPIALKRAARYGEGWMGAGATSSADFVKQAALMRQFLEEAGRDPATFPISKRVYLAVDTDRARAERRLREYFGGRYANSDRGSRVAVWGAATEVAEQLRELITAGAGHLLLNPVFDHMEQMEILADAVVPHLRQP